MQALVAPVQDVKFDIETALEMQLGAKPLPFPGMDKSGSAICTFHLQSICDIGSTCPFRHVRADRSVVCKHWLRGLCKKGDDCEFLHEYDMAKMPECYFFQKFGECGNKDCPFLHIDPETKKRDCPWYDRGFCRHGASCVNRHVRRVICQNYVCGFCPKGKECKFSHPSWLPPVGKVGDRGVQMMPTCHYCKEVGHVVYKCFKLSPEERLKYQAEHDRRIVQQAMIKQNHFQAHKQYSQQHSNESTGYHGIPPAAEQEKARVPLGEITCYKCGENGHFANKCPKGHLAFISLAKNQQSNPNVEQSSSNTIYTPAK